MSRGPAASATAHGLAPAARCAGGSLDQRAQRGRVALKPTRKPPSGLLFGDIALAGKRIGKLQLVLALDLEHCFLELCLDRLFVDLVLANDRADGVGDAKQRRLK